MKKIIFLSCLLSIAFIGCTCEPEIEDGQRSLFQGKVVDIENNPLEEIPVNVLVTDLNLGASATDTSGDYRFISLVSYFSEYTILLNENSTNPDFSEFTVNFLNRRIERNNDIGVLTLPKTSKFELIVVNDSNSSSTLNFSLEYRIATCNILEQEGIEINYDNCFESLILSRAISPEQQTSNFEILSIQGTSIELTYRIDNQEPQSVSIPLNQANVIYELQY